MITLLSDWDHYILGPMWTTLGSVQHTIRIAKKYWGIPPIDVKESGLSNLDDEWMNQNTTLALDCFAVSPSLR